ncbi:MAG: relaxase/mobilization nuclease domain-containing protein [Pseudomonadota bacterium]
MILFGSQRGGASNLANHLMNDFENDHVTLYEVKGFVARDLHGALSEAYAISKGTKCEQFMFSLSINPPKGEDVSEQELIDAANRAEEKLGLDDQPRSVVFHEKEGRRHTHVVWSRIDASTMKAINLPHFKNRLKNLSRELFLDHGWELPDGLRRDGGKSPLNFTLDEWQQAKRLGLDPREIKQSFQDAWKHSDSKKAFQHALEDKGYFLARGDRRGFVALDIHGEVLSVPRMLGIKTKEVRERLGDPEELDSVDRTKQIIAEKVSDHLHGYINQVDDQHAKNFAPFYQQKQEMKQAQRQEREQLKVKQKERWQEEARGRAQRFNNGMRGLWDRVSGRHKTIREQNEKEVWVAAKRDQVQRDNLVKAQMQDRRKLQKQIEALRRKHAQDRKILARDIAQTVRMAEQSEEIRKVERQLNHHLGLGL